MEEFYIPPAAPANITDLATGTRNLDAEGLGALRVNPKIKSEEISIHMPFIQVLLAETQKI